MKHSDFKIGMEFICGKYKFRVTDVGTRVIVAIHIDRGEDWCSGPPYAMNETVFDEYEIEACEPLK